MNNIEVERIKSPLDNKSDKCDMPLKYLTVEQHVELTSRLVELARKKFLEERKIKTHEAGITYTSLMACFLLHILFSIETILQLYRISPKWFPVTNAYIILRSVFEANILAHYISKDPQKRAISFIEYGRIIKKKRFESLMRHKDTRREPWHTFINETLNHEYYPNRTKIEKDFNDVREKFEFIDKKGKKKLFSNFANKSIREMAKEVDHEIEYDLFYADLSNFAHSNVKLADVFLSTKEGDPIWTTRSKELDIAFVFRYAATFLSCFLSLFGRQFGVDIDKDIQDLWNFS